MWREAENLADDFADAYRQGYPDRDSEIVHCKDCKRKQIESSDEGTSYYWSVGGRAQRRKERQ